MNDSDAALGLPLPRGASETLTRGRKLCVSPRRVLPHPGDVPRVAPWRAPSEHECRRPGGVPGGLGGQAALASRGARRALLGASHAW